MALSGCQSSRVRSSFSEHYRDLAWGTFRVIHVPQPDAHLLTSSRGERHFPPLFHIRCARSWSHTDLQAWALSTPGNRMIHLVIHCSATPGLTFPRRLGLKLLVNRSLDPGVVDLLFSFVKLLLFHRQGLHITSLPRAPLGQVVGSVGPAQRRATNSTSTQLRVLPERGTRQPAQHFQPLPLPHARLQADLPVPHPQRHVSGADELVLVSGQPGSGPARAFWSLSIKLEAHILRTKDNSGSSSRSSPTCSISVSVSSYPLSAGGGTSSVTTST